MQTPICKRDSICTLVNLERFEPQNIYTCRPRGTAHQNSGNPDFRIFEFRKSGFPENRMDGKPKSRISGIPVVLFEDQGAAGIADDRRGMFFYNLVRDLEIHPHEQALILAGIKS